MVVDAYGLALSGGGAHSALSEQFTDGIPVDGACVSVVGRTGAHAVISSTGDAAQQIERLHFGLGEGPHWDALATGRPVLVGDLHQAGAARWPAFAGELDPAQVSAIFSFPMTLGVAVVGVVDLDRREPGELDPAELREALSLTRAITAEAVHLATVTADSDDVAASSPAVPEMRREVHQATGMVSIQLDISVTDAFAALRAYSFAHDRSLEELAADIVSRRLDLTGYPS